MTEIRGSIAMEELVPKLERIPRTILLLESVLSQLTSKAKEGPESKVLGSQLFRKPIPIDEHKTVTFFGEVYDVVMSVRLSLGDGPVQSSCKGRRDVVDH